MKSPLVVYRRAFSICRTIVSLLAHIGKLWSRSAYKAGIGKTVFLDDGQCLVCFAFIGAEIKHPMGFVDYLPVSLDLLDSCRCRVKGHAVFACKGLYR